MSHHLPAVKRATIKSPQSLTWERKRSTLAARAASIPQTGAEATHICLKTAFKQDYFIEPVRKRLGRTHGFHWLFQEKHTDNQREIMPQQRANVKAGT